MQIIFGDSVNLVRNRFTVLELDTFYTANNQTVTAWCVIDSVPLEHVTITHHLEKMHQDLMAQYAQQKWQFCLDALVHLKGKWNGELDSFYQDLETRILSYKLNPPDQNWTPVRTKTF